MSSELNRTTSIDDLTGGLWKLGRTASEAEFNEFLLKNGLDLTDERAEVVEGGPSHGGEDGFSDCGMSRVASLDMLREWIMKNPAAMPSSLQHSELGEHGYYGGPPESGGGGGGVAGGHEQQHLSQVQPHAGGGVYRHSEGRPPMEMPPPPPPPCGPPQPTHMGALSSGRGVEVLTGVPVMAGCASGSETSNNNATMWNSMGTTSLGAPVPELKPAMYNGYGHLRMKTQTSKGGHTGFSRRAPSTLDSVKPTINPREKDKETDEKEKDADELRDEDDEDDDEGIPKDFDPANPPKHLSKEEIRRLRRMISNRESARRSRRRKLEHVQCLDSQINQLQNENNNLVDRLNTVEQHAREAMYENCQLKEELEALKQQLRNFTGKMNRSASMQRVASQEHLAKRGRGGLMRETPDEAAENCRQESAGCGLFRSLGSYENIVQLQFSSPGVTGS